MHSGANSPSDAVTMERARSLANEAMFTVALQRRRVRSNEPEDDVFVMRSWADLQFFIVALRRLRRAAELAGLVTWAKDSLALALRNFDHALPQLSVMRNVGEHIDDYAVDSSKRRHKDVDRCSLQVGSWDGTYQWLGKSLNIDVAHKAAFTLFAAISAAAKTIALAGIRVPRSTGAPLCTPGFTSTSGHSDQSIFSLSAIATSRPP